MSLNRSKSTPEVAPPQPFLRQDIPAKNRGRPQMHRQRSESALSDVRQSIPSPPRHYRPARERRTEDPFSLAGFFPSETLFAPSQHFDSDSEEPWLWLQEYEGAGERDIENSSPVLLPLADFPVQGSSSSHILAKTEDTDFEWDDAIRQEDKLGILSMPSLFVYAGSEAEQPYEHLLSPYSENDADPPDSEGLYQVLHALRQAHSTTENAKNATTHGLFSPADVEIFGPEEEVGWQSVFGVLLDVLSF
ncbi:hypothetical protein PHLCEN_2v8803 [Hermanssonia centrifuga]|uniref:Uncharacterized protein n=1 Tax=Hermanssonia centrifuga TaxID=98765 RepID=A0A2R6NSP7_9APHY|nr:hypothetical protein PHLCEN_2v8803 [Hermanssonia centrifuga]